MRYWMKDFDETLVDLPRLLYVLGPFEDLTNEMLQSLLESLAYEKCLKRQHFMVLFHHNLMSLDLSSVGMVANNDAVVKTIMNMCPKLTILSLKGLNNISARALADLAWKMPQLRVLDLTQTGVNDQVLSVLGHNCLELNQLLIPYTKVTNSGAYSLCQSYSREKGCKKLAKLSLFGTMVGSDGALHCLKHLPLLYYLGYDDICGVIELDVQEKRRNNREVTPYNLRSVITHGIEVHPMSDEGVTLACNLCPNAVEVLLYYKVTNENIQSLKDLQHLTKLGIGSSHGLSFDEGLLPVLKVIGHQLLELTLADVNDFDLLQVGFHCRNLQKLIILLSEENEENIQQTLSGVQLDSNLFLFRKLTYLEVTYPMFETDLQKSAFIVLLKNAKELKHLALQYVSWLTTEIFLEILEENELNYLEECGLVLCNDIDGQVIERLVYGQNNLRTLKLHKCRNITRKQCETLQKYVRKNNMELAINWS